MRNTKALQNKHYGIELLRIIAMLMVVSLHVIHHFIASYSTEQFYAQISLNSEIVKIIYSLTVVAVNCFALISGYVGINSHYRYGKIIYYWVEALFYSIVITVAVYLLVPGVLSTRNLVEMFLPASNGSQWYFTAYFLMFFMIPGLNVILKNMSRTQLKVMMTFIVLILSIFPTLLQNDSYVVMYGYSALWLAIMYIIGGYFAIYKPFSNITKWKCFIVYLGCSIITFISRLAMELFTMLHFNEIKWGGYSMGTTRRQLSLPQ